MLARDDDDGNGDGGNNDGEDPAPTRAAPTVISVEEEIKLRLCELKTNGAAGSGLSEADMTSILRIVALAGQANTTELFATCDELTFLRPESPTSSYSASEPGDGGGQHLRSGKPATRERAGQNTAPSVSRRCRARVDPAAPVMARWGTAREAAARMRRVEARKPLRSLPSDRRHLRPA